jgi:hypothetical protein
MSSSWAPGREPGPPFPTRTYHATPTHYGNPSDADIHTEDSEDGRDHAEAVGHSRSPSHG